MIKTNLYTCYCFNFSEPCGFICGMMTWVMVLFGMYVVSFKIIEPWLGFSSFRGAFHVTVFNALCCVAMYTHWRAMTTDPGAVPKDARPLPTDDQEFDPEVAANRKTPYKKYCRRCKAFKPKRAHHCSICERCVIKMDHHCPWVNNCVGLGNTKFFLQFLFSIFVISVYAIALLVLKSMNCSLSRRSKFYCPGTPGDAVFLVGLLVEGILFGLFTLCMLADQSETITSNRTQIDRLKNERHDIQEEINEVFGTPSNGKCHCSWFLPTQVDFPSTFRDKIFGYILPQACTDVLDRSSTELTPLHIECSAHSGDGEDYINMEDYKREKGVEGVVEEKSAFNRQQVSMRKRVSTPETTSSGIID